jgi:hypothetical protein
MIKVLLEMLLIQFNLWLLVLVPIIMYKLLGEKGK